MTPARANTKLVAIIAAAIVVALCLIAAAVTYTLELWGGKTVPDLTSSNAAQAVSQLESAGFANVTIRESYTDNQVDKVIALEPAAGTRIDPNAELTVVKGIARTIPALQGATEQEARDALEERGATNVNVVYVNSDNSKGTVIDVQPAEGATFKANDEVTVRIALPYTVPDVTGLAYESAARAVEEAGLSPQLEFAASQAEQGTIIGADPEPGSELNSGSTVTLKVAVAYPTNVYHVAEYFTMLRPAITSYLASEGFAFHAGRSQTPPYDQGKGNSVFYNGSIQLYFGSSPYSHHIAGLCRDVDDNPLNDDRVFEGIRLVLPSSNAITGSFSPDKATAARVATICGLGSEADIKETCTFDTIVCPYIDSIRQNARTTGTTPPFYCAYGEKDTLCWTVLITKLSAEGGSIVVTIQPRTYYPTDLSEYNGSICNFVAYCDMFTE